MIDFVNSNKEMRPIQGYLASSLQDTGDMMMQSMTGLAKEAGEKALSRDDSAEVQPQHYWLTIAYSERRPA